MRSRLWMLLCLLCLTGTWFFWPRPANLPPSRPHQAVAKTVRPHPPASVATLSATVSTNAATSAKTNQFAYRLSNTTKTIGQLVGDRHAILLENALIDTTSPLNFSIPKNLQSQGDPGAYIVQAHGPIDNAFRAMLAAAGAEIVSYLPDDAYLVRAPAGVANGLASNPLTQAVIPYEPYYKISSSMPVTVGQKIFSSAPVKTNRAAGPSLLVLAMEQVPLPPGTQLKLGLFNNGAAATVAQIEKLGGRIVARDRSPFGPVVCVQPPQNWTALATLPGVQIVEPYRPRVHANDLSRAAVGVAADTQVSSNYLGLTGLNVIVDVNDSGIDATHPDLMGRVFGDPANLVDTVGHGTHVAGTIAGSGLMSTTVTNASGSIMPATNGQFRGMAPAATLFSMDLNDSDQELQEAAAQTNALISNNSWGYDGDTAYDLAAASYDAAVRDALPEVTGSQPVLFVFAAGDDGGGSDAGSGGNPDTILSPATAKNVITVGAVEQYRDITNVVTQVADGVTNTSTPWELETSTGYSPFGNSVGALVPGFSSRGNVGIGTEGTYGRYKPDVVAPGTFVISTRSSQWDEQAYYNPTNYAYNFFANQVIDPNTLNNYNISVPANAVGVMIQVVPNILSPSPFPTNLPIYVRQRDFPTTNISDFVTWSNGVSIPPNSGGAIAGIQSIQNSGFYYAVGNTNNFSVSYDLITEVITTNDNGNYFQVLSNLNDSLDGDIPPHYYRYESGTSMAAADVSGVLALMEDYFTNTLQATPSPALLKAMLINGARADGNYDFQVQNAINYQGWGLINLPDSLPPGVTTNVNYSPGEAMLILDQNPANALATGDSHTYMVTVDADNYAQYLPLRVTLAWTDPPGNPAAAIKLVNSLELVVSNADTGEVFYGNDIAEGNTYNTVEVATNAPNLDSINNVQNVFIQPLLGTQYFITVMGYRVNVNAVTANPNNVVQDYALVISCGEGEVTNAFTVTDQGVVSNPTSDQDITDVVTTNAPLMNQLVGASTPLLGTNTIPLGDSLAWGGTNAVITLGMINQWHFYVVVNNAVDASGSSSDVTNAAFVTFIPDTLSIPRMGVFADSVGNATRPEADIDLYVSTDPSLTNLNPVAISNCVNGAQVGASVGGVFNGASLGRGGTEFVVDTNSTPGQVYYVGVQSEDQMASEYGFMSIFTSVPFSQMNSNGDQIVNGSPVPVDIPDGSPLHPGSGYIFGLALYPMQVQEAVVTNIIAHQNFGDLIGTLNHGGNNGLSENVVLNNHDSLYNSSGIYTNIYDDSGQGDIGGSQPSDGPGTLNNYVGQQAIGPWILTEVDDALTHTGSIQSFTMLIVPHQNLGKGIYGTVAGGSWFYDYIDVPAGATSLTISATNLTAPPASLPLQLFVQLGAVPTLTNYEAMVMLTGTPPPGGMIYLGAPLAPGRYWIGIWNPNVASQYFYLIATIGAPTPPGQVIFSSSGPVPILDDAVITNSIFVTANQTVSSVEAALRVDHPRVSDLVFHLISPAGTRCLLVENRGGTTTEGMGATLAITNNTQTTSSGDGSPSTNVINLAMNTGTMQISYNFYPIPDEMVVYAQAPPISSAPIFDSGLISGSGLFTIGYTNSSVLTIVMDPYPNDQSGPGDLWDYTVNASQAKYTYLVLTEDTNKTTTPIKFAPVPFQGVLTNLVITNMVYITNWVSVSNSVVIAMTNAPMGWSNGFEGAVAGDYANGNVFDGWTVNSNQVTVISNSVLANLGINLLALADGTISRNLPTVPGQTYTLTYAYRGPDIASLWRGENNALDSISGNNGSVSNDLSYAAGEVNSAFSMGTNGFVLVPPSASLNVGTNSGFTAEGWIYPTNTPAVQEPIFEWWPVPGNVGVHFYIDEPTVAGGSGPGCLFANVRDTGAGDHYFTTAANIVVPNAWQHVALTYDRITGVAVIYLNGSEVANANLGTYTPWTSGNLLLGYRLIPGQNYHFLGRLDEMSIYGRDLSASEIQAIYQKGSAGKYNTNAPTIAQGLAQAQVTVGGVPFPQFYGNNTTWQTNTITFTAGPGNTVLQITGLEPGMLLDNFVLTNVVVATYWTNNMPDGFEGAEDGDYPQGSFFDGWVVNSNQVVVVTTETNLAAYEGSNFLALANGWVSRILPTVAGNTYQLSFYYRLTNTLDIDGSFENPPGRIGGVYSAGQTFGGWTVVSGDVNDVLDFLAGGWQPADGTTSIDMNGNTTGAISRTVPTVPGQSYILSFAYAGNPVGGPNPKTMQASWDGNLLGTVSFNITGHTTANMGWVYTNFIVIGTGSDALEFASTVGSQYGPTLDAVTLIPIGQAQVSVGTGPSTIVTGTNSWQTTNIIFTATQSNMVLQIASIEPGMLLDDFILTQPLVTTNYVVTTNLNGGDVFYLPEQSLDTFAGESAQGQWQLEVWDNRAGATNPAPSLVSWQLRFNFASNLNSIGTLTNGLPVTNVIPPGGIEYYLVEVPLNADWATNILFSTTGPSLTGPLNVWFNPTTLPAGTNPPDYVLITNSTGGSSILGLATTPTNIVPGGTYYLGVQNLGTASVTYGIVVNFHLLFPPVLPPTMTYYVDELTLLTVTNTATSGIPPYTYTLVNAPAGMNISANGIITWTPTQAQSPGFYVVTNVVTDSSVPPLSSTNAFNVIVIEVNMPPYFLGTPTNQTINPFSTLVVTNAAGDPDIHATLTYSLVNPPAGMTIDPNTGIITWTPTQAQIQTITTVVTGYDGYAPVNQYLTATNYFTVYVTGILPPPFAFTEPATSVTGTSAQLNGMATPNDSPATAWFEWGTSTGYGNQTPPVGVGGGLNVVYVTNQINGLVMNQPYHFRLVVSNFVGVVYGFDQIFDEAGVAAWGADYAGQVDVPPGLSNVVAIAAAYDHSLALINDGTVTAWGDNTKNQTNVPPGLNGVVAVAGGEYYSMALLNNGTVVPWGGSILGQTNVPAGLNGVVNIAGGTYSSLALRNDGTVAAWGANFFGLTNFPSSLSNIVAVAGGGYHSLALVNNGTVVAWGNNSSGQTDVPPGLTNVVAIAGGSFHSLALINNGTVVAWGDNSDGQTNVPPGLSNVVAIAAGGFDSLVLKNDGSVLAWGDDSENQTNIPPGLSNVVAVSSGYFHNLALASSFSVNLTNTPPFFLTNPPAQTVNELTTLLVTNTASNTNLPPQTLTYTVTMLVDTNAMIINGWPLNYATTNPSPVVNNNGVISWTPDAAQGPGVYIITTVVTDNGAPPLSATNSFIVTVNEVNQPPVLTLPPNTNILEFAAFTAQATATDPDIPPVPLTFALVSGPLGLTVTTNGLITWTPGQPPGPGAYPVTISVTDTNAYALTNQSLSVTNQFNITVTAPLPPVIAINSITRTNIGGMNGFLLQWQGPTNFQYEIQWTTNLMPLIVWHTVLNPVINVVVTSTNGHFSFFDNGTLTGGFGSLKFYRVLGSLNLGAITNSGPATNTVLAGAMSQAVVAVPANATSASNFLISATGPLNVWFNQTNPPTGNTNAGDFLRLSTTNAGSFVLNNSVPPLVPGTNYYLGFQNPGASNVTFIFQVAFGFTPPIAVSNFSVTATNSGVWLKWNGLTNYQYQVQWTTSLVPPVMWNTISNIVLTSTTGVFTFFDDGSLTGGFGPLKFYRLIAWPFMTPIPQTLSISSVTVTNIAGNNDLVFRWSAPTNYQYGIQWTTNLALPYISWFIITNPPPALANGVYTFIDNGLTGPQASAKFFRIFDYP